MSQERMRKAFTLAGMAATLALAGCGDGLDDLRADIAKAKQRPGGRIQPLPEVRPYVSHEYQMADRRSPFLQSLAGENPSGPRPDVQRPREYLEQFPLDTMQMVGTLQLQGRNYGLVQGKDGLVHRVLPGNYMGQNDGRVVGISSTKSEP